MRQNEVFPYYRECCDELERVYRRICRSFGDEVLVKSSVTELCTLRGYQTSGEQFNLLCNMKICCASHVSDTALGGMAKELGLLNNSEQFLLSDRFIIPVRGIDGKLLTLIGYYPDSKKYITCPAPFFSKDVLFFNIDDAYVRSYKSYNGVVFLVEGIFDCLSLRSIGLPVIATMGSTVSQSKGEILKLFKKVVYIPDNDVVGRKALNRRSPSGWKVPSNATGIKLMGSVDFNTDESDFDADKVIKVKDTDNLVSWFDADSVKELLLDASRCRDEIVRLAI